MRREVLRKMQRARSEGELMTNVRPMLETNQEVRMEQQILARLDSIQAEVRSGNSKVDWLSMVLLGAEDKGMESPHGRVPIAEKTVTNLEARVKVLEDAHIRMSAYGNVFSTIGGMVAGLIGAVVTTIATLVIHVISHK
jgi:hypothetical protein